MPTEISARSVDPAFGYDSCCISISMNFESFTFISGWNEPSPCHQTCLFTGHVFTVIYLERLPPAGILTACNPGGGILLPHENHQREKDLEHQLVSMGRFHENQWRKSGWQASGARLWCLDLDAEALRELGQVWEQDAISIADGMVSMIACGDGSRHEPALADRWIRPSLDQTSGISTWGESFSVPAFRQLGGRQKDEAALSRWNGHQDQTSAFLVSAVSVTHSRGSPVITVLGFGFKTTCAVASGWILAG